MIVLLRSLPDFMVTDEQGVGFVESSPEEKKTLAKKSIDFQCEQCGFKVEDFKEKLGISHQKIDE